LIGLTLVVMAASTAFGWFVLGNEHFQGVEENSDHPGGILDYVSFHAAASLIRAGDGDKIYDLTAIGEVETQTVGREIGGETVLPYLNPPFVALALAPFAGLELTSFVIVLFVLNAALFVITAAILQNMLALRGVRQCVFYWLFCVSVFPVFALFLQQQLTLWICLAWLGLVSFEAQGKQGLAGASLALGLVKPQMILLPLLFLVYQRRWKTLASFSAVAAPLVLISLAVTGPQGLIDYPRFLLDSTAWETNGVNARQMFGWNGIVADLTGDLSPARIVLLALAAPTLALALVAWSWRARWHVQQDRLPALMGLMLVASLLVNPHLYLYDMTLANLALALGAVQSMRSTGAFGVWPALAVGFWIAQLPLPGAAYSEGFPLLSLSAVGLFVALWVSLRTSRAEVKQEQPAPVSTQLAA
jgi:hypothetical protein